MLDKNSKDTILLQEIKNGNPIAMEFLATKYSKIISSLTRQYFLIGAEQEDLIQEGLLGLYKATLDYQENSNTTFSSFAYLCIKRQIQSAVKTANRQKSTPLNNALFLDSKNGIMFVTGDNIDSKDNIIYLPHEENNPETELINKENYQELVKTIKDNLSANEYKILKLYISGLKLQEIADITNNTYKSVDNSLYRIKTKLQFLNTKNRRK